MTDPIKEEKSPGFWLVVWRRYRKQKMGMIGLIVILTLMAVGFLAPMLANDQPIVCKYEDKIYFPGVIDTIHNFPFASKVIRKDIPFRYASFTFKEEFNAERGDWAFWTPVPFGPNELANDPLLAPDGVHKLGTDESGRDVLARMIHGTSISIRVGFISMGIATIIGLVLGSVAGYAGGWIDMVISRLIEVVMCFPTFFIILSVLAWLPPSIENVMIVIGLTRWVGIARYARAEILRLKGSDFAMAATALGVRPNRVVFRHLLPNAMAPIMVSITFGIAQAILSEAALSWLGFGVQAPDPSWGTVLRAGYENLFTAGHMVPPACIAIFLAVLSFNLVGDSLRDVVDPRLNTNR
jgi:peptide/nickel transport system permease protein